MGTIPVWMHKLIDRVNASGDEGVPGILDHFPLFLRAGKLVWGAKFLGELEKLVELHEPRLDPEKNLHGWMEDVLTAFLGFSVEVPEPPKLNRRQRRAMKKYGLRLFFIPAITEAQYPSWMVKPAWDDLLDDVGKIERISLPGCWVAIEVIEKHDSRDVVYPDDKLVRELDLDFDFRFGLPHSGMGQGDDIETDLLPMIAGKLGFKAEKVMLPSVEEWNFLGNLFNWLREHRGEDLPNLEANDSSEWCRNACDPERRLIVGASENGGLSCVFAAWFDSRDISVGFRVLVVF